MLLTLVLTSTLLQISSSSKSPLANKVVEAIDQNYLYAESDSWKHLRPMILANADGTVSAINRELAALHDGDLRIITKQQITTIQAETAGKERGIGLVDFAVTVEPKTDEAMVVTPLIGSPAFKAGLRPGDVILNVNGRATGGLNHEDVMSLLRGNTGALTLAVRRAGRQIQINIPMKVWDESPVVASHFVEGGQQLGYIGIRLFTPDSGTQTRKAFQSLAARGINGCIIDLRNNPGGYLDAMAVAGSAFTDRPLGWKVRRNGKREAIHSSQKSFKAMRLVILIDEGTASAAEILAAGLRDTVDAKLVGEKTYGRGQIQTYVALDDATGVVIPAASAESIRGIRFNNGAGLVPDVIVASTQGESVGDVAYQEAVALLAHK